MKSTELRQLYLDYFKTKGHTVIPSASLLPENDPTVLFTTAGMHPLVPYLVGEKHPMGVKLANSQKCIRTDDIDEVGDKVHHTFFEMLGNWSFGDYFKTEAIEMSFEFLTNKKWLGLDINKLAFSVFAGDDDAPFDNEAYDKWISLGISPDRIAKLPKKNNWWGPAGQTGPCGPDTEMFYWTGESEAPKNFQDSCDDPNWVEIWNDVFMQYNKTQDGIYQPLTQKNVDTGMGLERALAVINGLDDNYKTDLFLPIIQKIEQISGKKYPTVRPVFPSRLEQPCHPELVSGSPSINQTNSPSVIPTAVEESSPSSPSKLPTTNSQLLNVIPTEAEESAFLSIATQKSFRIIADHIKAAVFAIADGAIPSNKGAGYVVRKLIRRAIVKASQLGIDENFTAILAQEVINIYHSSHPELVSGSPSIIPELEKEENKFRETLIKGLEYLRITFLLSDRPNEDNDLHQVGKDLFNLYQSYGFPFEISIENLQGEHFLKNDNQISIVKNAFEKELINHQELSRTASAGMFKGGLADASEQTTRLHTAAHLLLAALRQVLGDQVYQKGSNITAERLRFDFSHLEKMTPEQIKQAEDLVNEQIQKNLPVTMEEMTLDEAKKTGAMGVFESKYGDKVKVYTIGLQNDDSSASSEPPFSREICGGPHVQNTSELGKFKIKKEESSSSGVRRIKAILE